MARILVVDDVPMTRRVIELALTKMGHEVVGTCSPAAARTIVKETAPDLLILDYFMPSMDGATLLRALRAEFQDGCPRALFVSAAPHEVVLACAEPRPGFVSKPFRFRELERAVSEALDAERSPSKPEPGPRYRSDSLGPPIQRVPLLPPGVAGDA